MVAKRAKEDTKQADQKKEIPKKQVKSVARKTAGVKFSIPKSSPKKTAKTSVQSKSPKRFWRTGFTILFMVIFTGATVIVSQLVVGYLMLWTLGAETLSQTIPMAIYSALSYALATIIVIYVSWRVKKTYWQDNMISGREEREQLRTDLGLNGMPTWTDIGLAPVAFMASLLLAAGLLWVFNVFPWFNAEETQDVGFSFYLSGMDRIVAFIVLVVIAPIFEEIIFRGWLYGEIRKRLSTDISEMAGIVISSLVVSLLFGVVHMQWNVGVNVFALSVVLCVLREMTGTIYAGILTHMVKNGVAFYLLYVIGM